MEYKQAKRERNESEEGNEDQLDKEVALREQESAIKKDALDGNYGKITITRD